MWMKRYPIKIEKMLTDYATKKSLSSTTTTDTTASGVDNNTNRSLKISVSQRQQDPGEARRTRIVVTSNGAWKG